jgi:hypothetical protein
MTTKATKIVKRPRGRQPTGQSAQWGIRFPPELAAAVERIVDEWRPLRPRITRTDVVLELVAEALAMRKTRA